MASRTFSKVQSLNKEIKIIAGRFDNTPTKQQGLGYTVASGSTGVYTITLDDSFPALIAANVSVQSTTGVDNFQLTIASHDVVTAKTIVVHCSVDDGLGAGVLTNLGAGDEIHFSLFLQNSSLPSV